MPYQFGEYVSTYVDPQSVKISEALRDRFIQSFNTADAVGEELNKLKAADFETDQRLKNELDAKVKENLAKYAQAGDYENMTFDVAATAREYKDRSAPISENYNRYAAYQQDLAKQYQKGKISSAAYRNAIPMTKALGYSGLSIDPKTGMVDPKSYFSGPTIVSDPKITDRLIKVLSQIEADSTNKTISGLYTDPATGEMKYTSKQGWEGITEEKVSRAYEAVMADPEVQAYLNQESKFRAYEGYSNPDGTLNADALNQASAAGIQMHQNEINKLAALIGSPKTSKTKKEQYQATLDAYQQSLNYLSGLKDPAQQLNYAASLTKEQLLSPYKDIASLKVYNKSLSDYDSDYSDMEKDRRKAEAARKAEIEKLQAEAASKITFDREGGIDEVISESNVDLIIDKAEANIKSDTAMLTDPNVGSYEKEEAKNRIATNQEQLALARNLKTNSNTTYIDSAVDGLINDNDDVGDIDNWGFGTYGVKFSNVYNSYKAFRGGAGDKKDFYRILSEGPGSAEYEGLASYLSQVHSGENGKQILADSKAAMDTKLTELGSASVEVNREFSTKTAPLNTNPTIGTKAAEEVKSQFKTLGDLTNISGLIYRPADNEPQTKGSVGGEGNILDSWSEAGFTADSKITNIRWGVANGMELTDQSQYGQYAILTISPKEEGEDGSGAKGTANKPYKEIYVPIEKIMSADQIESLNEPVVKLQRHVNTIALGTRYAKDTQQYEFKKDFTDEEKRAINFSRELTSKNSADAAKFLKENAATFEEYITKGYLLSDGSFAGMPYAGIIIDVTGVKQGSPKAEIFMLDVNGNKTPMIDPNTGQKTGAIDMNGEIFRSIVNDQNVGLYKSNGYNLINIK